jgi:ribonucleotide monophosphatase NagD (HAD superfamily)
VLPNPDLIFPVAEGSFGITAGAIATMIEAILQLRFPDGRARFHALGKPHAPIFEAGWRRAGQPDRARVVMVGDQIVTDIAGANRFGIDSALALTGISRVTDLARFEARPTWVLSDLRTFS